MPRLNKESVAKVSCWEMSYIQYMLENNKWKDSLVETTENKKVLMLTRLDGMKFLLKAAEHIFYNLCEMDELTLIFLENLENKSQPN